jgi:hypothetical protein
MSTYSNRSIIADEQENRMIYPLSWNRLLEPILFYQARSPKVVSRCNFASDLFHFEKKDPFLFLHVQDATVFVPRYILSLEQRHQIFRQTNQKRYTRIDEIGSNCVHINAINRLSVEHRLSVERIKIGFSEWSRKLNTKYLK